MWYIGQRVVCIKEDNSDLMTGEPVPNYPKVGEICTIETIGPLGFLDLAEYKNRHPEKGFYWFDPRCFRPIQSFGEEVAERISNEIEQEVEV